MNTGHDPEAPPGFTSIKPTQVDLTATADPRQQRRTPQRFTARTALWAGAGAGALLLGAFYLFLRPDATPPDVPTAVAQTGRDPADSRSSPNVGVDNAPPPVTGDRQRATAPAGGAEAPWELAQQSQLRRQSQEILGRMLDAQKTLEEKGVTHWADTEYRQALESARAGDAEYSRRNFSAAQRHYTRALESFMGLLQGVEQLFETSLANGREALYEGNAPAAEKAFGIALAIDPADRAALSGIQRAGTLDQVTDLVEQGDAHLQDGRLKQARDAYRQALDVDDQSRRARQQLDQAQGRLKEQAFRLAMSEGFKQLEQRRYEPARKAFAKALKLQPGAADARSGAGTGRTQTALGTTDRVAGTGPGAGDQRGLAGGAGQIRSRPGDRRQPGKRLAGQSARRLAPADAPAPANSPG